MKPKTIFSRIIFLFLFAFVLSANFGCAAIFDAHLKGKEIPIDKNGKIDIEKLENMMDENQEQSINFYTKDYLGIAAGFGLNSTEGESETSICFGAEYNRRISKDNYNNASYLGAFAGYHTQSADDRKLNTLKTGLKYTYFDRITKNAELDLTYGIKGHYEFGSIENFGNKDDITGYGASLTLGANFNVSKNFSIGIEAPILSWSQRTFKYDGGEFEQQNTMLGINKNNIVMAYGRFHL